MTNRYSFMNLDYIPDLADETTRKDIIGSTSYI